MKKVYDHIIIGGGHNGLTCAAYLAKAGQKVLVLERRHVLGGAAITEEIVPGFRFSRASYLCSLLRPQVMKDLNLNIELIGRNPSGFTPVTHANQYLMLGSDSKMNFEQISKFSKKDAKQLPEYEKYLEKFGKAFETLMDYPPFDLALLKEKPSLLELISELHSQKESAKVLSKELTQTIGLNNVNEFVELLTAPAAKVLNRWFESEPLKATLSTDSIIGEFAGPYTPGSAYVLLHHVMADIGFGRGVWAYVKGGMGSISKAIASRAKEFGADLEVNKSVQQILVQNGLAKGVVLEDGTEISATKSVISNLNAYTTFLDMLPKESQKNYLPEDFVTRVNDIDFSSATFKINVAVNRLPQFKVMQEERRAKGLKENEVGPEHKGTIHFETTMEEIEDSYQQARATNMPSKKPVIEMTIPSSLDHSLVDKQGTHVVQLFTQYAPNKLANGKSWDDKGMRELYVESVFNVIEEHCPGFKESVIGVDMLSPLDLERVFGLRGGNIFHGKISLDQLFFNRPVAKYSRYQSPIRNLFMCGSGTHPGGGVTGACGRNAAQVILQTKFK